MPYPYVETLLSQWEAYGVFDFVLPFLLIFALVFGILSATRSFGENRAVHVIIALVVGLLALRLGYVQDFFREVFPRFGVALAVILVFVLLAAMFYSFNESHKRGWMVGLYVLGGVAALMVVFNAFSALGFYDSTWWYDWGSLIVGALFIIGIIIAVSLSGKPKAVTAGGGHPHP